MSDIEDDGFVTHHPRLIVGAAIPLEPVSLPTEQRVGPRDRRSGVADFEDPDRLSLAQAFMDGPIFLSGGQSKILADIAFNWFRDRMSGAA